MIEGIKLVRVDFRLIHGQVITKWSKAVSANHILVVNDELAADEFMADVYVMAAPAEMEVEVLTLATFTERAAAGTYNTGKILVLFKGIEDAAKAVAAGVPLRELQVGGLGSGGGKTSVVRGISIDRADADALEGIQDAGVNVVFQVTPEEQRLSLDKAIQKLK